VAQTKTQTETETVTCDRCAVSATLVTVDGKARDGFALRQWGSVLLDAPRGDATTPWRDSTRSDLCPVCIASFRDWMKK